MSTTTLNSYNSNNWMTTTPGINTLSLGELILPGAHNAGVDQKATYVSPGVAHWAACQNNSFYDQLKNGARALDVRVEYAEDSRGLGTFWFQHNGFRSSRSLENLVMNVRRFLEENPHEFVLLDFHELKSTKTPFDHMEFNRFLQAHMGDRIIPADDRYLNLGQLKQVSQLRRIWLAAERHPALDRDMFISQIPHKWSGIATTSTSELQTHITDVMGNPPASGPWSLSATSYSITGGPVDIKNHLNLWFDPVKGNWISNCSIINADFFEESKLVAYCRAANIDKAQRRDK